MRQGRARNFVIRRLKYEHAQLRLKKKKRKRKKKKEATFRCGLFFWAQKPH